MSAGLTEALLAVLLLLVAAMGTCVVLTREPGRQALVLSGYGVVLGVLMLALQAPDVAMSQLAVGAAVVPLLVVLTITKCGQEAGRKNREGARGAHPEARRRDDVGER
jgi:energy-converting hydrogenase B subunit D